jgi:hypothetical protein
MSRLEEKINACKMVVGKPHDKCVQERRRKISRGNNNVGLREIGFYGRRLLNVEQGFISWSALEFDDVELLSVTNNSFTTF